MQSITKTLTVLFATFFAVVVSIFLMGGLEKTGHTSESELNWMSAKDIAIFHDDKRGNTCYRITESVHNSNLSCVKDSVTGDAGQ